MTNKTANHRWQITWDEIRNEALINLWQRCLKVTAQFERRQRKTVLSLWVWGWLLEGHSWSAALVKESERWDHTWYSPPYSFGGQSVLLNSFSDESEGVMVRSSWLVQTTLFGKMPAPSLLGKVTVIIDGPV